MAEIKLFNEWLETSELSTSGIALWYALMYIANRSGWREELSIPVSAIMLRTGLSRSAVYKERNVLRDNDLIRFSENGGRQSATYRICSFESRLVYTVASTVRIQMETQPQEASTDMSTPRTQPETESAFASTTTTQPCTIYKPKQDLSFKEKDKYSIDEKKKSCTKKEKSTVARLEFIEDSVWRELVRSWLEYKAGRNQSYKSELSVKKFLTMLRNLSGGNSETAQSIIDKSIANNWAGIFELPATGNPRGQPPNRPATGQRIGQIKQPEDEARRQQLIDKFGKKNEKQ